MKGFWLVAIRESLGNGSVAQHPANQGGWHLMRIMNVSHLSPIQRSHPWVISMTLMEVVDMEG